MPLPLSAPSILRRVTAACAEASDKHNKQLLKQNLLDSCPLFVECHTLICAGSVIYHSQVDGCSGTIPAGTIPACL